MKQLGLSVLLFAFASSAFAAPACTSFTKYSQLVSANGGCEIGDKIFSDFIFGFNQVGGAIVVGSDDVSLDVVNQGNAAIGFSFIAIPLSAGAGQSATITLGFNVKTLSGAPIITSNYLSFAAGVTGTGLATVKETYCIGGVRPCAAGGTIAGLDVAVSPFAGKYSDSDMFAGVSVLGVTKDIFVSGGSAGTATISVVTNTVDQNGGGDDVVPEPGTYALLGSGLLGVVYLKRRQAA